MTTAFRLPYLFLLFVLACGMGLHAQTITTGDVIGFVSNQSGAAAPGCSVVLHPANASKPLITKTNESGQYRFSLLKLGDYQISAEASTLRSEIACFSLLVGQQQSVNLTLKVENTTQSVEVLAAASVLDTENANQSASFSEYQVQNLPMNGGDITNVAFTVPGVRLNVGGGNGNFNVNGIPIQRNSVYVERR